MPAKRALIVDDSTTAQYRLKKMLRPYGLHIDVMDSGEAALRYLATNEPDVIFMDHLMPGMDGFRVLQIIKSHPETAMIPVIMYTSKSGDVYTGQARALGALDVVSKDTINAADLSKVMQTIHIYRDNSPIEAVGNEPEATEAAAINLAGAPQAVAPQTLGAPPEALLSERRAPSQASVQQARNLELRLSHLEHTLEDSRRFITARVVREMQGLRQNLKQELTEALTHKPPPEDVIISEPPVQQSGGSGWAVLSFFLLLIMLVLAVFYANKFDDFISAQQDQQAQVEQQLKSLAVTSHSTASKVIAQPAVVVQPAPPTPVADKLSNSYLTDVAWTFNQTASIQFNQNNMDPKVAIRLHELLSRLVANGFRGNVLLNIYTGNFCVAIDSVGQAQLPPPAMTMANCVLVSEVYGLDQVAKRYANDIEAVLAGLSPQEKESISIIINSSPGSYAYPERQLASVREWNNAAQANNRLELRLDVSGSVK